jgi:hypothetical protein
MPVGSYVMTCFRRRTANSNSEPEPSHWALVASSQSICQSVQIEYSQATANSNYEPEPSRWALVARSQAFVGLSKSSILELAILAELDCFHA